MSWLLSALMAHKTPAPGPRLRSADGTELATWDLGGTGAPLVVLHATGFHSLCYRPMASALGRSFHVFAIDQRGHGASSPAVGHDYSWSKMADDITAALETLGLKRPVAFGHSLGGGLASMVEARRPGTFRALLLFEPIIIPPESFPDDPEHGLVGISRRRRRQFGSLGDALLNYASKPPFDRFRADALLDYVSGGFDTARAAGSGVTARAAGSGVTARAAGVRLHLSPDDEADTFAAARGANSYESVLSVEAPTTLFCGAIDPVTPPEFLSEVARKMSRGRTEELEGLSHFGPFEAPDLVASQLQRAVRVAVPPPS